MLRDGRTGFSRRGDSRERASIFTFYLVRCSMKGVVFLGDRKLEFRDFPDPTPGPGEVVIEMKASGMCGSDLKFYRAKGGASSLGLGGSRGPAPRGDRGRGDRGRWAFCGPGTDGITGEYDDGDCGDRGWIRSRVGSE